MWKSKKSEMGKKKKIWEHEGSIEFGGGFQVTDNYRSAPRSNGD